jgi:hypothetical protein
VGGIEGIEGRGHPLFRIIISGNGNNV